MPKPGNPSAGKKEILELFATTAIDFSITPYTIISADCGTAAAANGWISGGAQTYAYAITSGTVAAGGFVYVKGTNNAVTTGTCLTKSFDPTITLGAGGIGSANSNGFLPDAGAATCGGLAIFNVAVASITSSTVPIDAVFYGGAYDFSTLGKFTVPVSDLYVGGYFGPPNNKYFAPNPGNDQYIYANAGAKFYVSWNRWGTGRIFSTNTTAPSCAGTPAIALNDILQVSSNTTSTSPYLNFKAVSNIGSINKVNYEGVSGVISDPTDPCRSVGTGVVLNIKESGVDVPAVNFTATATSSNTAVVPTANITITKADGAATIKIDPASVGYTDITVTIFKSPNTETRIIRYGASAASTTPSTTWWHTFISDASGALPQDADNMITIDDEIDRLYVYSRYNSGLPLTSFDFNVNNQLNLTDYDGTDGRWRETDLEGITRSPSSSSRIYCIGSMGNGNGGGSKPDRDRLVAINTTGVGASTSFTYVGYTKLRNYLIAWGDSYGYDFTGSAASTVDPKTINGFNIEAMTFALDGTTLYIGFRAPLLPVSTRTQAVIAPLLNFETWFNNGAPSGAPSFGAPILFNFGGRSFRDIIHRQYDNSYIIVAGDYGGTSNGVLYSWNGNPSGTSYQPITIDITPLNVEGVMEVIQSGFLVANKLQLVSDLGSIQPYNSGVNSKDLLYNNHKKFRTDLITMTYPSLTVNLINFTAQKKDNQVLLKWQTANEENVDHFEIEKKNGAGVFKFLQRVHAVGNGSNNYQLADLQPEMGYNYYRLKTVDNNGEIKYSPIAIIKYNNNSGLLLSMYPNPVADVMKINSSEGDISYRIYNGFGQNLSSGKLKQGMNSIDVKKLTNGIYYLKTIDGDALKFNVTR